MRLLRTCLALGLATAAWTATSYDGGPWTDVWTMPLRGEERTYVDYNKASYLVIDPADFEHSAFLNDKDVMFSAQFERQQGETILFFDLPKIRLLGQTRPFDGVRFGDNVWVLGRISVDDQGNYSCTVQAVLEAPSDSEVLAARIKAIPEHKVDERLALAAWVRTEAAHRGNRDLWLETSQRIVTKAIEISAVEAARDLDVDKQLACMGWAIDLLSDAKLAAELATASWLDQVDQVERNRVDQFMHKQGFIEVDGAWLKQGVALRAEFEERLAALDWKDAEGHYQLARWADSFGDVLPEAEELRHKTLQAGLKADPYHTGIRSDLGLPPLARPIPIHSLAAAFADATSGLMIPGISNWPRHGDPIEGLASWGPSDATYYVSLDLLQGETAPADLDGWAAIEQASLLQRQNYAAIEPVLPEGVVLGDDTRLLACTYTDSNDSRIGFLVLILVDRKPIVTDDQTDAPANETGDVQETPAKPIGVRLWCSGLADDREAIEALFVQYASGLPQALNASSNDAEQSADDAANE